MNAKQWEQWISQGSTALINLSHKVGVPIMSNYWGVIDKSTDHLEVKSSQNFSNYCQVKSMLSRIVNTVEKQASF